MKRIGIFVIILLGTMFNNALAVQRTISWDPVTTYTDNTNIEPAVLATLRYVIMMDNVVMLSCDNVVGSPCIFEHANANQDHYFSALVRAFMDGNWVESAWSPPYFWHCPPAGTPSTVPEKPIILGPIRRP